MPGRGWTLNLHDAVTSLIEELEAVAGDGGATQPQREPLIAVPR